MVTQFRSLADEQLSAELTRYEAYVRTLSSDDQWLRSTATGSAGTASDRVSSATLLLQSQPVLNLSLLPELIKLGGAEPRLQVSPPTRCTLRYEALLTPTRRYPLP